MEKDKFTITLNIADAPIRPKIFREEEEIYRIAEKEIKNINAKYKELIKDEVTRLRALILQFAVKKVSKTKDLEEIVSVLEDINLDLEEFLENE